MPLAPISYTNEQKTTFARVAYVIRAIPTAFGEAGQWLDGGANLAGSAERLRKVNQDARAAARSRRAIGPAYDVSNVADARKVAKLVQDRLLARGQKGKAATTWARSVLALHRRLLLAQGRKRKAKGRARIKVNADTIAALRRRPTRDELLYAASLLVSRISLARRIRTERAHAAAAPDRFEILQNAADTICHSPPNYGAMEPADRERSARRVLLVAWILTDTADLTTQPTVTRLQDWTWGKEPRGFMEPANRLFARVHLLDPRIAQWAELCEDALRQLPEAQSLKPSTGTEAAKCWQAEQAKAAMASFAKEAQEDAKRRHEAFLRRWGDTPAYKALVQDPEYAAIQQAWPKAGEAEREGMFQRLLSLQARYSVGWIAWQATTAVLRTAKGEMAKLAGRFRKAAEHATNAGRLAVELRALCAAGARYLAHVRNAVEDAGASDAFAMIQSVTTPKEDKDPLWELTWRSVGVFVALSKPCRVWKSVETFGGAVPTPDEPGVTASFLPMDDLGTLRARALDYAELADLLAEMLTPLGDRDADTGTERETTKEPGEDANLADQLQGFVPAERAIANQILAHLRRVGHPLGGDALIQGSCHKPCDAYYRSILARMVGAGALRSRMRVGEHRGYGLPEWCKST